ncbi:MAG: hypothetical protein V3W28_06540 [Thermoplasmata archaeon]
MTEVWVSLICRVCGCEDRGHHDAVTDEVTGLKVPVCKKHGPCYFFPTHPHQSIWVRAITI